jgi:hypothetical protein
VKTSTARTTRGRTTKIRALSVAGLATAALATTLLAAAPASAASTWWYDPSSCTGAATAKSADVSGRTVQVRYGTCGGYQYGWGRILNYNPDTDLIRFEVDTNGDRSWDVADVWFASDRNYSMGRLTSSSSAVAFRACFVTSASTACTSANGTGWW